MSILKKKTLLFGLSVTLLGGVLFMTVRETSQQKQNKVEKKDLLRNRTLISSPKTQEKGVDRLEDSSVFKPFQLNLFELETFYSRSRRSKKVTLEMSGLTINQAAFHVGAVRELPEKVIIPLPGGHSKEFHRRFVSFENPNSFVWVGGVLEDERQTAHLSFYNQLAVGHIETLKGSYEIKYLSKDKHIIRRVDRSQENFDEVLIAERQNEEKDSQEQLRVERHVNQDTSGSIRVDIIVGYSESVEELEGSRNAALAAINLRVAIANTVLRNSQTGVVLGVTAIKSLNMGEIKRAKLSQHAKNIVDAHGMTTPPNYDATNPYHVLAEARKATGADLVTLFITESEKSQEDTNYINCGTGYLFNNYFSPSTLLEFRSRGVTVVDIDCFSLALVHEIGHNFGCRHNQEDASDKSKNMSLLPYAFGFRSIKDRVRTVMSSDKGGCCAQVMYFSNPDITIGGVVIGKEGEANNARVIREHTPLISRLYDRTISDHNGSFPTITLQPTVIFLPEGVQLSVEASSPTGLGTYYQWYETSPNGLRMKLGTEPTQTLLGSPDSSKRYSVEVWNQNGLVVSNEVQGDSLREFRITKDLMDLQLNFNAPAEFSVQVTEGSVASVTWYKDNQELISTSTLSLSLGLAQWFHRGSYWGVISHSMGSLETSRVLLRLNSKWGDVVKRGRNSVQAVELGKINYNLGIKEKSRQ